MHLFRILAIILILFFIISCATKESDYPVSTELIDGVKTITNPDFPRNGIVPYTMVEEITIGADEEDEKSVLVAPRYIRVSDDGTIFILDSRDMCIKAHDSDGNFLRTIGRRGKGPGEFEIPVGMDLSSDGEIFIMDGLSHRVVILDTNGNDMGGFRIEGSGVGMKIDANNRVYFRKQIIKESSEELLVTKDYQERPYDIEIYRMNIKGEEDFKFGPFSGEKSRVRRMPTGGVLSLSTAYTNVWEVNKEGRLYQGFNQYYKINIFNPDGKHVLTFGREYTPVKNPRYDGKTLQIKHFPAFNARLPWFFDEDENLWIGIYKEQTEDEIEEAVESEETIYDVFSPDGIYIKQVILPYRIYYYKNGKAYSITSTEEGFRVVKRFSLIEQ